MREVRSIYFPEGSQSILEFVVLEQKVSIWNLCQLKQFSVLLTQEKSLLPLFHFNMKGHQTLHIPKFQKNLFGISMLFAFLEESSTI